MTLIGNQDIKLAVKPIRTRKNSNQHTPPLIAHSTVNIISPLCLLHDADVIISIAEHPEEAEKEVLLWITWMCSPPPHLSAFFFLTIKQLANSLMISVLILPVGISHYVPSHWYWFNNKNLVKLAAFLNEVCKVCKCWFTGLCTQRVLNKN